MSDSLLSLFTSAEQTLHFSYESGGVTCIEYGHTTGWRTMPVGMISHLDVGMTQLMLEHGKVVEVHGGEAVFVPPSLYHRIDKVTCGSSISRWSHITCSIFGTVNLFSLLEIPFVLTGRQAQRLGEINEALARMQESPLSSLGQVLQKKALGFSLLATLAEQGSFNEQSMQTLSALQQLVPLLSYIEAHLEQPLSRQELAELLHLSPSQVYKLFQRSLGLSPSHYIQRLRFQTAQNLLLNSSLSVGEIAQRVGYPDVFHFSRLFKKHVGLSPAHYRKLK